MASSPGPPDAADHSRYAAEDANDLDPLAASNDNSGMYTMRSTQSGPSIEEVEPGQAPYGMYTRRSSMQSRPSIMSVEPGATPHGALLTVACADELLRQLRQVLEDALREHAAASAQQLESLRKDIKPILLHSCSAARPPAPVPQLDSFSDDTPTARLRKKADRAHEPRGEVWEDFKRGTTGESGESGDSEFRARAKHKMAPCSQNGSDVGVIATPSGRMRRMQSKQFGQQLDLKILEEDLTRQLFESEDLPVTTSKLQRAQTATLSEVYPGSPASTMTLGPGSGGSSGQNLAVRDEDVRSDCQMSDHSGSASQAEAPVVRMNAWSHPGMAARRPSRLLTPEIMSVVGDGSESASPAHRSNSSLTPALDSTIRTEHRRNSFSHIGELRLSRERELTNIFVPRTPRINSEITVVKPLCPTFSSRDFGAPHWASLLLLHVCGVLPWSMSGGSKLKSRASALYQSVAVLLCVLAVASCIEQAHRVASLRWDVGLLSDMSLALGSLFGLLSIGVLWRREVLTGCNALLTSYAHRENFLTRWARLSWWELVVTGAGWLCAVVLRVAAMLFWSNSESPASSAALRSLAVFIFSSLIMMGLAFGIVHTCCALTCMVDSFCCLIVEERKLADAVHEWNVTQAVLRRACSAVEKCVFTLLATIVTMIMLSIADVVVSGGEAVSLLALLPVTIVMLCVVRIPFKAAAVTDRCARVPALVNSLSFGRQLDHERQYVVDYIIHSSAGFYVFEVRLTSSMALKFLYINCVCAFAVTTKVVSDWQ